MPLQQPKPVSTAGCRARGKTNLRNKFQHGEVQVAKQPYQDSRNPTKVWLPKETAYTAHDDKVPMDQDGKAWDEASTAAGDLSPSGTTISGDLSPCRARLRAVEAEDGSPTSSTDPSSFAQAEEAVAAAAAPAAGRPAGPPAPALGEEEALVEQGLARLLSQMSAMATPAASAGRSPFKCKFPPGISIHDYVARLLRLSKCSPGCVVLSLVYLDRLIKRHPRISVCPLTCHRLVLTSVVVAIKFYDDTYYSNKFYSQVGGLALKELNSLEMHFLGLIGFKLCVDPQEYELYRDVLQKAVNTGMAGAAPGAAESA